MENFYVTIENEEDKVEVDCAVQVVLILKFWNELRNTEIISTFKTLYYSASGFLICD
jgi:hypothetical protein